MAQYDVHLNPSHSAADGIPYVVVIQSDLLDALATRLTLPLAVLDPGAKVPTALCPVITVKGRRLHALAHYAAPAPEAPRCQRRRAGHLAGRGHGRGVVGPLMPRRSLPPAGPRPPQVAIPGTV